MRIDRINKYTDKPMDVETIDLMERLNGMNFDYFATFTIPGHLSAEEAGVLMRKYRWRLKKYGCSLFYVYESFEFKTGYHIHANLCVPHESEKVKSIGKGYYERLWHKVSCTIGNAKVEVFDQALKVDNSEYLTKQITRSSNNYDFL